MARVVIMPDRTFGRLCEAEMAEDGEGQAYALTSCGERLTDRGHYTDTVQVAMVHVDACSGRRAG